MHFALIIFIALSNLDALVEFRTATRKFVGLFGAGRPCEIASDTAKSNESIAIDTEYLRI